MSDATLDLLPGVLREMAELIGLPATLILVDAYGGVRLYVPCKMPADHPLVMLIGLPAAEKLAGAFGGSEHFDIPRAVAIARQVRNRKLREDRASLSHRHLAQRYGMTERQVRNILGEEYDDRQLDMFSSTG